jgi:hypothetical protein
MKRFILSMLVTSFLTSATGLAVTIEDHLPLLKPNPTELGTGFLDFLKTHPLAKDLSLTERKSGIAFTGMLSEDQPDGSLVLYGFTDNELASLTWASKATGNLSRRLKIIRDEIIQLHGSPRQLEYAARMDSGGSIAKVAREVFQSKLNNKCVICLMATSGGIEVFLTDESVFEKHGRLNTRQTYEDAVKAVGDSIPSNSNPSTIVDYLVAARADAEQPKSTESQTPSLKPIEAPPPSQPKVSPKPTLSAEALHEPAKPKSATWLWWLIGLSLGGLAFIANALRKRRR